MPAMSENSNIMSPNAICSRRLMDRQHSVDDDDDEACFVKPLLHEKRKLSRPDSPVPSLCSESSSSSLSLDHDTAASPQKKQKKRRVSFDTTANSHRVVERYDVAEHDDLWWSKGNLHEIMRREGALAVSLKSYGHVSSQLQQTIQQTFKQCVQAPVVVDTKHHKLHETICVQMLEANASKPVSITTTTRGLERFLVPLLGAHKNMVTANLLQTQDQLAQHAPSHREQILHQRYQHMSKVATNFAIVMAHSDAWDVAQQSL